MGDRHGYFLHRSEAWWTGLLFAIGSACFGVASVASQWASTPRPAIGVTFFVGSLFFTSAAYLQLSQATKPGDRHAAAIQFAGTLFFNVSTFQGMKQGFDAREADLRVWTPDVVGSVCFLVSSELAFFLVAHRWVGRPPRTPDGRMAALNMVGSIAFGVSAAAALVEPSTDEPVSAAIANAGTSIGALCFLLGALVLMREGRPVSDASQRRGRWGRRRAASPERAS